jgi:stage V sporulation protein AE
MRNNKNKGDGLPMGIVYDLIKAFVVGGLICVVGQILIDLTKMTPAKILVAFVVVGVVLGAAGVYGPLVDWAGAGATVPLTGFGYALAKGTREAIAEQGASGILTGAFTAASGGVTAAVICGVIASLATKSKEK